MKVLVTLALIGCVSAFGSGPYPPSGWRPDGPAFLLPTEIQKSDSLQKEIEFKDSVGFTVPEVDSIPEYEFGKLPEVSQDLTQQALPDVVTELPFTIIDANQIREDVVEEHKNVAEVTSRPLENEPSTEAKQSEETTTESQTLVEQNPLADEIQYSQERSKLSNIEAEGEETTAKLEINENIETTQKLVETFEQATESAHYNDGSIILSEEREGEAKQGDGQKAGALVESTQEQVTEKDDGTNEQGKASSSNQVPEGFLEYGPPAFREYGPPAFTEYGPPKQTEELKTSDDFHNEIIRRRRKISPKFRI